MVPAPKGAMAILMMGVLLRGPLLFAGFNGRTAKEGIANPSECERWLGAEIWAVLNAPDTVQAFALRHWPRGSAAARTRERTVSLPPGTPPDILGYPVYAASKENSVEIARGLSALILRKETYAPKGMPFSRRFIKGCAPQPDAAFRLSAGGRAVVVLIDFSCDQVGIATAVGGAPSGRVAIGDIDPSRGAFLSLVKRALPGVPEIAAIPEIRRRD